MNKMASLPPADPTQTKLEKAVTKMPKPKELEAPDMKPEDLPAPGSGPFGTTLTGAGSIPSAPAITPNVTGDKTPQALLTTTTDIAKQTTQAQKEPMKMARYALARRMTFRGLNISIETDKGEKRHWYDPHNKEKGTTTMKHPYGYIRRTKGVDGDHVDVYVGPNEQAKNVYIIHQMKAPEFKQYDEDKCMLGFDSADAAKKAYLAHYNKPGFFGSMTTMSFDDFKKKVLKSFELKQPHKIAEAIMHPQLKTAYLVGAQHAKFAFDQATATAPTAVPVGAMQPNVLGGLLDTAESSLGSLYAKGKQGLGKAYQAGESGLDRLLAALKKRKPAKSPEQKKEASAALLKALLLAGGLGGAGYGLKQLAGSQTARNVSGARTERGLEAAGLGKQGAAAEDDRLAQEFKQDLQRRAGSIGAVMGGAVGGLPAMALRNPKHQILAALLGVGAGGLGGWYAGKHHGSNVFEDIKERLAKERLAQKEGQAMPSGEPMMPPDQATADTAVPPELAAPALGDPNFWGGSSAAAGPEVAGLGGSAEDVIGLLPAGTFQGMNVRITPDGQKSTGLKVTPEAIDAPQALKAVFQAEPTARVEITTPDTPSSVTSFKET